MDFFVLIRTKLIDKNASFRLGSEQKRWLPILFNFMPSDLNSFKLANISVHIIEETFLDSMTVYHDINLNCYQIDGQLKLAFFIIKI